jgi:hypothetical protein
MFSRLFSGSVITEEKLVANPSLKDAPVTDASEQAPVTDESAPVPAPVPGSEPVTDETAPAPAPVSESVTDVTVPENSNKCGVYCTIM